MEKEFVPYELAVKLKALGFDEPCFGYFNKDKSLSYTGITQLNTNGFWVGKYITAPTFSQAFRWFREKYDLPSNLELLEGGWDYVIYLDIKEEINYGDGPFETYEEAELVVLTKLIEIVESKSE